jgi:hypothetical protein
VAKKKGSLLFVEALEIFDKISRGEDSYTQFKRVINS